MCVCAFLLCLSHEGRPHALWASISRLGGAHLCRIPAHPPCMGDDLFICFFLRGMPSHFHIVCLMRATLMALPHTMCRWAIASDCCHLAHLLQSPLPSAWGA